jgi:uncharacterized protein YjbJ (UPF0337 family)
MRKGGTMDTRKLEGKWKILKGTVLEELGKLFGSEEIQRSGEAQRVRGKIESAASAKPKNSH